MAAIKYSSSKIYFQLPYAEKKQVVLKKYMTEKDRVQNKFLDFSSNTQRSLDLHK